VNNVETLKQFNGTTIDDFAGDVGGNIPYGLPKWRGQVNITYEQGPFIVDIANRYIGKGTYDNTQPTSYNVNTVPSIDYTNLSLQYTAQQSRMQIWHRCWRWHHGCCGGGAIWRYSALSWTH
jgi:hypothetical protein